MLLKSVSLTFGCDPEMFFTKDGKVVPSTNVIKSTDKKTVATDGFQFELHPKTDSNYCRQLVGRRIAWALNDADEIANREGVEISTETGFVIDDETFKSVPPAGRRFGCNPTSNIYENAGRRPTGLRIKLRTGGGHVHLGLPQSMRGDKEVVKKLVRIFDIVAGNNLVFFDQSEASTARRKYYGRAGEFRLKPYGLEYRVPSNFWLKDYRYWSMVTGLMRGSVELYVSGFYDRLVSAFDETKVREAINTNSKELAMENLITLCKFLREHEIESYSGITSRNCAAFVTLAKKGAFSGVPTTSDGVIRGWNLYADCGGNGFEATIALYKDSVIE